MIQRITGQLPAWMRADHPIMRQALKDQNERTPRGRYIRALLIILLLGGFLLGGYVVASRMFTEDPFELPLSQMLISILFWPAFCLQLAARLSAMLLTINTVGEARRRQTWDNLRTTFSGAALTLRTRWTSVVFYRIRWIVLVMILVRVVLIGAVLFDLTAFRGEYLNYLIGNIIPQMPLVVGVFLLALMLTASLLIPITGLGFDAALGLLISTVVKQRTYVVLTQIAVIAIRGAIIAVLLIGVTQFRTGTLEASNLLTWLILAGFAVFGDWGLSFLYLGYYGAVVWADVPYGIMIGLAMLGFVMVQAALTDGIMLLAIQRAEHSG